MINSGNTEVRRATMSNLQGRLAVALLAAGALACSGGERADASAAEAADSAALAAPTTASTATGTVAATNADSAAAAAMATAPATQPASGVSGVNRDSTPTPVARGGGEQLKTRAATPPSETKRLDSATRTAARQGAATRDTARSGVVTPPPPVRKTAAPAATASAATTPPTAARTQPAATPASKAARTDTAATAGAQAATAGGAAGAAAGAAAPAQASAASAQQGDKLTASPAAYQGWKTFHVYCYRCHGTDAVGSDLAPNLRNSVGPQGSLNQAGFVTTVKEGRLEKGMPAWKEMLTDEQIQNLYAYVKARSTGQLAAGRPRQAKP